MNKQINKTCFHMCLEVKQNETVGLYLTVLTQEITQDE